MLLTKTLTALASIVPLALAKTHTFNYTAAYVKANPDGMHEKEVIGFNGEWPLPAIHVNRGDRIELFLTNGLKDKNTSLHFHGLFMEGQNYMDGPQMVTQCPIPPGETFLYNFTVGDQVGSYWYHSHSGAQYGDGLRGPLIIHDDREPFDYDEEKVITISETYHGQYDKIAKEFLNRYNPTGAEPIPQNLLLNESQNVTINFEAGKTYLLRIINMGLFVSQYLYLEDHEFTIVEVDGVYVQPYTVDYLYMAVAQRYTVLVKAKSDPKKNYAFMQKFDNTMLDVIPPELKLEVTNYVVYDESLPLPKPFHFSSEETFNEFNLRPLEDIELFDEPDYRITLDVIMDNLGDGVNYAFFNNLTYVEPKVPTLLTVMSAGKDAVKQQIYGSNTHSYVLQPNDVVEIVVNNKDTGRHPFHLHGHVFQMVQKSPAFDDDNPISYDPENHDAFPKYPLLRDTAILEPNGYMVLRFKADNPGVWFFHCHVDWHLEQGLAITLIEDPLSIQKQVLPEGFTDICDAGGIRSKGNAAGNSVDFFDLTGERVQPKPLPEGFTLKGYIAFFISTVMGLYGIYSIIQYGLEDSIQDDKEVFRNLENILKKNNLLETPVAANENTRL
ncbi:Iron transport multicopper oxidase FET5 [Cyberlindnera fabianii]|uniref:Iron transport multicopper oxidase FET5 n=1 Tax=Cyberlindnera fabianii TaxID=36022 RepID=A0A1V2L8L9_CYBFA|nr:Iron transport multicopper oxidase FET5 [Cyberlindnera fabianii]